MGRSRIAWAGSAVAPWGIALGLLVSITAQADQDPDMLGGTIAPRSDGPVGHALDAAAFRPWDGGGLDAALVSAHFTTGSPVDLSAVPDEIDPKTGFKSGRAELPKINRAHKGDPFIALRPGLDARARSSAGRVSAELDASGPTDSQSPNRATLEPARPALAFGDGLTPTIPLDVALNSATPTPSEGKLRVAVVKAPPAVTPAPTQTTVAAKSDLGGKPNYASLIDTKDSARQMRCLAEAIYFESRSEPEAGQAAVAQVVLNRVRSGIFPTDVCGVVYQDRSHPFACQFSFACEGKSLRIEEPGAWAVATRVAKDVVSGANFNPTVAEALNYHAHYVMPFWAPSLRRVDRIGAHIFYAMRVGTNWAPGALNGRGDLPPAPAQTGPVRGPAASPAPRISLR
jgi:spore germination cell wall hydrolase CwlJ-like protein